MWLYYKWKVLCLLLTFLQVYVSLSEGSVTQHNVITTSTTSTPGSSFQDHVKAVESEKTLTAADTPESHPNTNGQLANSKSKSAFERSSVGYAAEWEFEGHVEEDDLFSSRSQNEDTSGRLNPENFYPSSRVGPGTWHDDQRNWWLFGGRGQRNDSQNNAPQFLSDLWVYSSADKILSEADDDAILERYSWKLVFQPETNSESPYSSFPENLEYPLLCGSESSKHIALFGAHKSNPSVSVESRNSPFSEDNVVWLFDIPKEFIQLKSLKPSSLQNVAAKSTDCNWSAVSSKSPKSCNGTGEIVSNEERQGLWTSYVCCDECLPDGDTTFEFCPQFSRDPISWCVGDALMMLQLGNPTPKDVDQDPEKLNLSYLNYSTSTTTFTSGTLATNHSPIRTENEDSFHQDITATNEDKSTSFVKHQAVPRNTETDIKRQNASKLIKDELRKKQKSTNVSGQKSATSNNISLTGESILNWWKFDLVSTEWIKMPEVKIDRKISNQIRNGNCRVVVSTGSELVYILCPTKASSLDRSIFVFNPKAASIRLVGTIHLNDAFKDESVWKLGNSVLYSLHCDNQTVIFLAYHKLLDLWIHNHSSDRLYPVENVWKGSSLHVFQTQSSFYKVSIALPIPTLSDERNTKSVENHHGQSQQQQQKIEKGKNTTHTFFILNPRSKPSNFDDPYPPAHFHITIVPDREVFLPRRDAALSNVAEIQYDSISLPQNRASESNHDAFLMDEPAKQSQEFERETEKPHNATFLETTTLKKAGSNVQSKKNQVHSESQTIEPPSLTTNKHIESMQTPGSVNISSKMYVKITTTEASVSDLVRMEEHRRNKYRLDPTSPKRGLNKEEILRNGKYKYPAAITSVGQKRRILGISRSVSTPKNKSKVLDTDVSNLNKGYKENFPAAPAANMSTQKLEMIKSTQIPTAVPTLSNYVASTNKEKYEDNVSKSQYKSEVKLSTKNAAHQTEGNTLVEELTTDKAEIDYQTTESVRTSVKPSQSTTEKVSTDIVNKALHDTPGRPNIKGTNGTDKVDPFASTPLDTTKNPSHAGVVGITFTPEAIRAQPTTEQTSLNESLHENSTEKSEVNKKNVSQNSVSASSTFSPVTLTSHTKKPLGLTVEITAYRTMAEDDATTESERSAILLKDAKPDSESTPKPTVVRDDFEAVSAVSTESNKVHRVHDNRVNHGQSNVAEITTGAVQNDQSYLSADLMSNYDSETARNVEKTHFISKSFSHENVNRDGSSFTSTRIDNAESVKTDKSETTTDESQTSSLHNLDNDVGVEGEVDEPLRSLTYGSSEIVVDRKGNIVSFGQEGSLSADAGYGPTVFFASTLSFFAIIGVVLFVRRCVKCPPRRESVLIKEPPPIRYSVVPDDLSFHTPLV